MTIVFLTSILITGGGACRTLAMRDTDDAVTTMLIALTSSGITTLDDLKGRTVAAGSPTSSELRLIPGLQLRALGLDLEQDCTLADIEPRPASNSVRWIDDFLIFDAVKDGTAGAGLIFEPWLAHLTRKRGMAPEDITVICRSEPYCHCAFTARPELPTDIGDRFVELLTAMPLDDPRVSEMIKLEHLTRWLPATDAGWTTLIDAIRDRHLEGTTFN